MKQLIVLGNGFDLSCGLKSRYEDFFIARFNKLYCSKKYDTIEKMESELESKRDSIIDDIGVGKTKFHSFTNKDVNRDYFKSCSKQWSSDESFNRWDVIFLFAQSFIGKDIGSIEWQDVESIIFEVVSIALNKKYDPKMLYKKEVQLGSNSKNGKDAFKKIIYYICYVGNNTPEEIATELLSELKKFEAAFSKFIVKQVDLEKMDSGYIKNATDLYSKISKYNKNNYRNKNYQIDVLNFNYSLDEKFKDILDWKIDDYRLHSWTNMHGIAHNKETPYYPAPIFGIDNHEIDFKNNDPDYRVSFTKAYRVIDGDINKSRSAEGYAKTDLISIYGHSLSQADYSYFETIFDENELYYSDCKIEYYYYPGMDNKKRIFERQKAITSLYNLLTNYGETLSDSHGSNIVNKLNLENRISLIPMDEIDG